MAIAADQPVIGGPVAGLGMQDLFDSGGVDGVARARERPGFQATQPAQERHQVAVLFGRGGERRHGGPLVARDDLVLAVPEQQEAPIGGLQLQAVQRFLARKTADRGAGRQPHRDQRIAVGDLRAGICQLTLQIGDRHLAADAGEVGTRGFAAAHGGVTQGAPALAEEETLAAGGVARGLGVEGRGVHRANEPRQRLQLGFGQGKWGHAAGRAIVDDIVNLGRRAGAQPATASQGQPAVGAGSVVAVTGGAVLGEKLFRTLRSRSAQNSDQRQGNQPPDSHHTSRTIRPTQHHLIRWRW